MDLATGHRAGNETYVSAMTNELRVPVNSILGLANVLAAETFGALNPKQAEYVEMIERTGRDLLALLQDVVQMSELERGQLDVEEEEVDLASVVRSVIAITSETAAASGVQLRWDGTGQAQVVGDRRRLRQVAFDLIGSAIRSTPAGGYVWVKLDVDVRASLPVSLEVGCTGGPGPSLSPGLVDRDVALAMARCLVEIHGGTLETSGSDEAGATYVVRLPSAQPTADIGRGGGRSSLR